jgi:GalNAc-alpha-(1->4)-GalNAc-alpha-(1->3)-diNAcBac-PP-undecaprenol alpha-1,4-N-acetyl-D-galactosaminyltransferase
LSAEVIGKDNMVKKKLCLVIPSLQAGGMERVMAELSCYFALNEDIEQHLVLYGIDREIFYLIPESIIIHTPDFTFNDKRRLFYTFKTLFYLRQTVKGINPDSILSFGELWNTFVLLALFGLKYPVYISDRCSPEKKFSVFQTYLRRLLYPHAKGIIAQTEKAKEVYTNQFSHINIKVIGNPIREISNGSESAKQNIVLMVGRLIKSKNQDKLIDIFLNINIPGWKLIIVGYDHLQQNNYERLQEIIRKNQAEHKVLLEGKQADVESFYRMSKIFAFTSSSEGFPNVIGEAMSAGLPAVSFDCVAGPSEMIKDNYNGFLIQLFNYTQFQEKLEILMKDDDLRIRFGENARKDIKQFSAENIGKKYLQFIMS